MIEDPIVHTKLQSDTVGLVSLHAMQMQEHRRDADKARKAAHLWIRESALPLQELARVSLRASRLLLEGQRRSSTRSLACHSRPSLPIGTFCYQLLQSFS